ncbi:MAG: helix-turn-helix transcriptional regulator [Geodermatophilaceae bacterium]
MTLTSVPPSTGFPGNPPVLVGSREELVARVGSAAAEGAMAVVTGASGIGRTAVLGRVAELFDGPVLIGGGLAGLGTVPHLALSRALRLPVPHTDASRAAEFVVAAAGRSSLLVLDDLHLCDPRTLEVVALLAGQLAIVLAVADDTAHGAALTTSLCLLPSATGELLQPLDEAEAAEVARSAYRGAAGAAVRSIVGVAGGNPAALVAMTHDPDASDLRVAVANRLAKLGPDVRTVLCLLGLLGRPAEATLFGESMSRAAEQAGVVVCRDGWISARSKLDVEVAVAVLAPHQRRPLHAHVARLVSDPGERARHLEAAGQPEEAISAARQAATQASSEMERVQHLALAARLTAGPGRAEACLDAGLLAADCGDHRLAVAMASAAGNTADPRLGLLQGRAALAAGNAAAGLAHLDGITAEPDATEVGVLNDELALLIAVERARALCLLDPIEAMTVAADAYGSAVTQEQKARAGSVLGAVQLAAGADGWRETLESARAAARECGRNDVAFAAAANLCSGLVRTGNSQQAAEIAVTCAAAAERDRATSWAAQFRAVDLWVAVQVRASLSEGQTIGEALLDGALTPLLRREVSAQVGLAYADGGDLATGRAYLGQRAAGEADLLAWCLAELDALGGDRRGARAHALAVLRQARRWPVAAFAAVTASWAGLPERPTSASEVRNEVENEVGHGGLDGGASAEVAALALLDVAPVRAAELFTHAADRWAGLSRRSVVRCRLAAAMATAKDDPRSGLVQLRILAAELENEELVILARQVTRGRRQLGDAELPATLTGPRGATLSRREAEVMAAVTDGLTSVAIAGLLGVAPSTVETQIKSAMRKLGATTRTEAAVLAAR